MVVVSEPNLGVDSLANCSAVGFVVNSGSSTQGAVVGVLACEMADFRELAAAEFAAIAAVQAAFG